IIICSQSPVFRAACTGSFKEASSQTYNMDSHPLPVVQRLVDYLYTGDYSEKLNEADIDDEDHQCELSFHAVMFALANKYDIEGLEALSAKKYAKELRKDSDVSNFLLSIPDVYNLTPGSSRGLRDLALEFAREKLGAFLTSTEAQDVFNDIADDNPEFIRELLSSFLRAPLMGICFNCGHGKPVPVEVLQCRCRECGKGGASILDHQKKSWF
ncbi:hypothetical protein B0J13DRAFT_460057, partial [Dactylonectria estremocensis]